MREKAIIVDIDGTISDGSWRVVGIDLSATDWNQENLKSLYDQPFDWCVKLVNLFHEDGYKIIFLTARTGTVECYQVTHQWLNTHLDIHYELFMREEHDKRDDYIIKQDIYYKHIQPHFDVLFTIDDSPEVIDMWRNLGITALHCRRYIYG